MNINTPQEEIELYQWLIPLFLKARLYVEDRRPDLKAKWFYMNLEQLMELKLDKEDLDFIIESKYKYKVFLNFYLCVGSFVLVRWSFFFHSRSYEHFIRERDNTFIGVAYLPSKHSSLHQQ